MMGRRKHIAQMSPHELHSLLDIVRHLDNPTISGHAQQKMSLDGIRRSDITKVLREGSLVEFNMESGSPRIMLKGNRVAVVLSLETQDVVTVWREVGGHPTLKDRTDMYNEELEIWIPEV